MLSAEARVETERSGRYLAQLCRHISKLARERPQMRAHSRCADDQGVISFGWGRCTLRAQPGLLSLRAEAPDEESLRQIQGRVAERLALFGRREQITVAWTPPRGTREPTADREPAGHDRGGHDHG